MKLEMLLFRLRERRDILVSENEIWWSSAGPDPSIQRALSRHRRGVALLIHWSSTSTCSNPDLHRQFWYHAGLQVYRCALCERFKEVC